MTISALSGPVVTFGQSTYPGQEYNPDLGPSLFYAGVAILDPRQPFTYTPGQDFGQPVAGFLGTDIPTTIFATPATITATAIAAAAAVTANTAMTLVSSSSATTGIATGLTIVNSNTGVNVAGVLAIDAYTSVSGYISNGTSGTAGNLLVVTTNGNLPITVGMVLNSSNSGFTSCVVTGFGPATGTIAAGKGFTGVYTVSGAAQAQGTSGSPITITGVQGVTDLNGNSVNNCRTPFGQSNSVQLWNPQALVARAVSITPTSGTPTASITFAVSGYDVYGYPMTENILLTTSSAQSTAVPGLKAFKYITRIVPSVTDSVTYSVGTTNVIGLPFRSDTFADVLINYSASLNPVQITSATGYTAAVLTPATGTGVGAGVQTTGDVRGTYTLQTTAATATNRLVIKQTPLLYNIGSSAGLFGNTQA